MSQISQAEWNAFLIAYYQRAWGLAWECLPEFVQNQEDSITALSATFDKLAAPAVYLTEKDFTAWKASQSAEPLPQGEALRQRLMEGQAIKAPEIGFVEAPVPPLPEAMEIPEKFEEWIGYTEFEGHTIIAPRKFLGTLTWREVNDYLKGRGWRWIPDGKHSRWST